MSPRPAALAVLALLCIAGSVHAATSTVVNVNWTIPPLVGGKPVPAAGLTVCKGSTVKFSWAGGLQHNLWHTKDPTCSTASKIGQLVGLATTGSYTLNAATVGTYYYACFGVLPGGTSHCTVGHKMKLVVKTCSG